MSIRIVAATIGDDGWLTRIANAKLVCSMSRKGRSPNNTGCAGLFGRLKSKKLFARDRLSTTIEEFAAALDAYIRWYNNIRIKSSLGFRIPLSTDLDLCRHQPFIGELGRLLTLP